MQSKQICLREYQPGTVRLDPEEVRELRLALPNVTVQPEPEGAGLYRLTPGPEVGAVRTPLLAVEIRPKIDISQVLFLISYSLDPKSWRREEFAFEEDESVFEAVALGFGMAMARVLSRGLLLGYRLKEEALQTVRGRIRMDEQIRRRFGRLPPMEVAYDDFTEDIEENRLLLAAVEVLGRMRIRSEATRRRLRHARWLLQGVSRVDYAAFAALPEIFYTRLNQHYRPVVELARFILRASSYDVAHGQVVSQSFLIDMNKVYEDFVYVSLREALDVSAAVFVRGSSRGLWLDAEKQIRLEPDLSWWEGDRCVLVGDAKYKRLRTEQVKNPDVYQMLAYTIATELREGVLIYPSDEAVRASYYVEAVDKVIRVETVDLTLPPERLLERMADLAADVRSMVMGRDDGWEVSALNFQLSAVSSQ